MITSASEWLESRLGQLLGDGGTIGRARWQALKDYLDQAHGEATPKQQLAPLLRLLGVVAARCRCRSTRGHEVKIKSGKNLRVGSWYRITEIDPHDHAHPVNSHGPTATGCTHLSEYRSSYVGASVHAPIPSSERNPLNG